LFKFLKSSKQISSLRCAISAEKQSKKGSSKDSMEFWFSYREIRWNVKKGYEGWVNKKANSSVQGRLRSGIILLAKSVRSELPMKN